MTRWLPVALAAALALALPRWAAGDEPAAFLAGVEDVPVMPGLTQLESAGVAFDASTERIVVAWAAGAVGKDDVLRFYGDTLPQLGWVMDRPGRFRRDGEALQLDFLAGDILTVRFTLSPD